MGFCLFSLGGILGGMCDCGKKFYADSMLRVHRCFPSPCDRGMVRLSQGFPMGTKPLLVHSFKGSQLSASAMIFVIRHGFRIRGQYWRTVGSTLDTVQEWEAFFSPRHSSRRPRRSITHPRHAFKGQESGTCSKSLDLMIPCLLQLGILDLKLGLQV